MLNFRPVHVRISPNCSRCHLFDNSFLQDAAATCPASSLDKLATKALGLWHIGKHNVSFQRPFNQLLVQIYHVLIVMRGESQLIFFRFKDTILRNKDFVILESYCVFQPTILVVNHFVVVTPICLKLINESLYKTNNSYREQHLVISNQPPGNLSTTHFLKSCAN